jgi:hypothetical protein
MPLRARDQLQPRMTQSRRKRPFPPSTRNEEVDRNQPFTAEVSTVAHMYSQVLGSSHRKSIINSMVYRTKN